MKSAAHVKPRVDAHLSHESEKQIFKPKPRETHMSDASNDMSPTWDTADPT